MSERIPFVIAYDIREPRRLQRVQRLISAHCLQLQYSVYYATMSCRAMDTLIAKLQRLIRPEDDIRIYEVEPLERAFMIGKHSDDVMLLSDAGAIGW